MNWQDPIEYAGDLAFAGHEDWRLPNVRELQSVTDYSMAPLRGIFMSPSRATEGRVDNS
jgi:hypothetical protein